jgi:hypothetical protein
LLASSADLFEIDERVAALVLLLEQDLGEPDDVVQRCA